MSACAPPPAAGGGGGHQTVVHCWPFDIKGARRALPGPCGASSSCRVDGCTARCNGAHLECDGGPRHDGGADRRPVLGPDEQHCRAANRGSASVAARMALCRRRMASSVRDFCRGGARRTQTCARGEGMGPTGRRECAWIGVWCLSKVCVSGLFSSPMTASNNSPKTFIIGNNRGRGMSRAGRRTREGQD